MRSGIIGLADIPYVNQFLSENTNTRQASRTMIVLKPVITRPPTPETFAPQFAYGSDNGERVLL
jgi:type II secretory pathway component GspD/PulD (secretin)